MTSFLEEKLREILERHNENCGEFSIILPNKRAAVYLYKYIGDHFSKPIFSPEIFGVNEWLNQYTDQRIISSTELLFVAYEVHKKIAGVNEEGFESFLKWGQILLSDFNEIDVQLAEVDDLFKNLRDIREIENWSFGTDELSDGQERYEAFWNQMPVYYKELHRELESRKMITSGMAYRSLATNPDRITGRRHCYFLGFNALNAAEESIINHLVKFKKGTIYFDADHFYVDNSGHEAGYFYRKYADRSGFGGVKSNWLTDSKKQIKIIETAGIVPQCLVAGAVINNLISDRDLEGTALVLADESLIIPMLNCLPESLEKANITMGYPLRYSQLKSLVDLIFELQFNYRKYRNGQLYFRNFLNLINHKYLNDWIGKPGEIKKLENEIVTNNRVFVQFEDFLKAFPELKMLSAVFNKWDQPGSDGFKAFLALGDVLYEYFRSNMKEHSLDLELMDHFLTGIRRFEKLQLQYKVDIQLGAFRKIFNQFWINESLAFLGNPIDGLQMMGILETRTLDFKNLIILGMNEGILPRSGMTPSFIPYDLRRFHGLPMEADREAIYAHHFYRLLQRAENVWLTYNSSGERLANSEQSRYLIQLEQELSSVHDIERMTYAPEPPETAEVFSGYANNDAIRNKLDQVLARGLSPSALNKLITCPLDFYYRYILDLEEEKEVEESFEKSTFGTMLHGVLEKIIDGNFVSKNLPLDAAVLKAQVPKLKSLLEEEYREKFENRDLEFGQNRLSIEVSIRLLQDFIDGQIAAVHSAEESIQPIMLEKTMKAGFDWEINGEKKAVLIKGQADRIDRTGDGYQIIDYKSGKCDASKVKLSKKLLEDEDGMDKLMNAKDKGYLRQLLMYALMYRQMFPDQKPFSAGIISLVNINEWIQNLTNELTNDVMLTDDILDRFELALKDKVAALYSDEFIFVHDPSSKYCQHCSPSD